MTSFVTSAAAGDPTIGRRLGKPDATSSMLGGTTGEFLLKVTAGSQIGRLVRLSSAKCTIGSAGYCTLRIHGVEIEPVQCVVLHGPQKSIIRRWAGSTLLNDRSFDDAPLKAGDRLAFGSVEFQVMSLPGKAADVAGTVRRFGGELKADQRRLDQLAARLELANRQGRRRLRAAVAKLRKFQLRMSELEGRRRLHSQEETQLKLEQSRLETLTREAQLRLDECDRRGQALAEEQRSLTEQGERLRTLAKQASQDRQAAQAALDARRADLEAAEARLKEKEADLERRLAQLAADQARAEQDSGELLRWEAELKEQAAAAAQRTAECAARACDLETRERSLSQQLASLAERQSALERLAGEGVDRHATIDRELAERERTLAAREQELRIASAAHQQIESRMTAWETSLAERDASFAQRLAALVVRETEAADKIAEFELRQTAELALRSAHAEREATQASESARTGQFVRREAELEAVSQRLADLRRELEKREADLQASSDDLQRQTGVVEARYAEVASAQAECSSQGEALAKERLELAAESERLQADRESLAKHRELVASRCEALKRSWTELVERERRLEERDVEGSTAAPLASIPSGESTAADSVSCEAERLSHETAEMLELLNSRLSQRDAEIERLRAELSLARESRETPADAVVPVSEIAEPFESCAAEVETEAGRSDDSTSAAASLDESVETIGHPVELKTSVEAFAAAVNAPHDDAAQIADDHPGKVDKEPVEPAPNRSGAGESAADVLRRLGLAAALDDNHAVSPPIDEQIRRAEPAAVAAPAGEQEDDSLSDYMAQLFQRLGVQRGEQAADCPTPQRPQPQHSQSSRPAAAMTENQDEPAQRPAESSERSVAPLSAAEFKARSVAAERKSDLSTLRELANVNARTAVASHQIRTGTKASRWKGSLALASAVVTVGACVAALLGYPNALPAALGGLAVTALFGIKSIKLRRNVKTTARSLDDVLQKSGGKTPKND